MQDDRMTSSSEPDDEMLAFAARVFNLARDGEAAELARMLEAGLPPNMTNHKGDSLLMLAAYHEHPDAVRALLAHGAEPDRRNDKGQTPLAGVCFKGNVEVARLLLDAGASADGPSGSDRTPLMTAAMFDRSEIVDLLLERGADPERRDGGGLTAAQLADAMGATGFAATLARWRSRDQRRA